MTRYTGVSMRGDRAGLGTLKKGGDVKPPWEKKNPKPKKKRKKLTSGQKSAAKRRAAAAGRPYPNLIDNMAVANKMKGGMAELRSRTANYKKGGNVNLSVGRGEKKPVSQGAGLTAKGRAKYNRATGSNLKAPAPNPKTPKAKARKKSFCARSRSWTKPGSRGAAARRRWNC